MASPKDPPGHFTSALALDLATPMLRAAHNAVMTCSLLRSPAPSSRPSCPLGRPPPHCPCQSLPAATAPQFRGRLCHNINGGFKAQAGAPSLGSACWKVHVPLNPRGKSRPLGHTRYAGTANPHYGPPSARRSRISGYVSSAPLIVGGFCDTRMGPLHMRAETPYLIETPIFGARGRPRDLNCTIIDRPAGDRTRQRVLGKHKFFRHQLAKYVY